MHRLDDLDVRIIKELGSPGSPQWNVRETYSNIGRRLGVDEETVRRRLKRAEEMGSLPGWKMMVNPHLLGCNAAGVDLEVRIEETKDQAISDIRRVVGVVKLLSFRGPGLQVTLFYPDADALKTAAERIRAICGGAEPTVWEIGFPAPHVRMKVIDWRIAGAMLDDARRSLEPVSESLGLSVRTVERRLTTIAEGRAVYLQGIPNFRRFAGLSCVFLVHCPDRKKKGAVDNLILSKVQRTELSSTSSKEYSTFVMLFDNLHEADDTLEWIRGLEGVKHVKMGIMKDLFVEQGWLRDEIGKQFAETHGDR